MKVWRWFIEVAEWLPIVAILLAVIALTDGFTKSLDAELAVLLGLAAIVNLVWIGFVRWNRRMAGFLKSYPGFRVKK